MDTTFIELFFKEFNLDKFDYENHDIDLIKEYDKDFDYNDGEEGVNGIIRYYHNEISPNNLVLIRILHDGDGDEDIEFTDYGKQLFKYRAIVLLNDYVEKLKHL